MDATATNSAAIRATLKISRLDTIVCENLVFSIHSVSDSTGVISAARWAGYMPAVTRNQRKSQNRKHDRNRRNNRVRNKIGQGNDSQSNTDSHPKREARELRSR